MTALRVAFSCVSLAGLLTAGVACGSSGYAAAEPRNSSVVVGQKSTAEVQDENAQLAIADSRARAAERRAARLQKLELSAVKKEHVANAEAVAARSEASSAQQRQAHAERLAQQRQQVADAARAASRRTQRLALWAGGGAAVLLCVILGGASVVVQRQRSRRRGAELAAESARLAELQAKTPPEGARDLLLDGRTPNGETIAIKVPAIALGLPRGAVIGRSPEESEYVINRQGVSRMHARLFIENRVLMVEDLKSTNGSWLNGTALYMPMPVREGDQITLDDVTLRLSFRGDNIPKSSVAAES